MEYRHELQAVREKEEMEARERALQEQQDRERRLDVLRQQVCVCVCVCVCVLTPHIRSYELERLSTMEISNPNLANFEFCFC